ncbi:hypothetical protein [Bacteroides sp. UBA939]|nr:hypothetical protein [Bacteroides sp. UBA939]
MKFLLDNTKKTAIYEVVSGVHEVGVFIHEISIGVQGKRYL